MKVYKLYYNSDPENAYIGEEIHEMVRELNLDDADAGEKWTIEVVAMTQAELDNLPDFDGF